MCEYSLENKSGLRTKSIGINKLGTTKSLASSRYVIVLKIVTGSQVVVSIRRTGEARDRTCDPWFTRQVA